VWHRKAGEAFNTRNFYLFLCPFHYLSLFHVQVMYGGRVIDDFDRRIVRVYMDEYMGDFLFDTFQPFHFYRDENVDYRIPIARNRQEFIGEPAGLL
jgi:dynein heavy chain, axonemal